METKSSKSSKDSKKSEPISDPLSGGGDPLSGGVVSDPLSVSATVDPLSSALLDPLSRAAAEVGMKAGAAKKVCICLCSSECWLIEIWFLFVGC